MAIRDFATQVSSAQAIVAGAQLSSFSVDMGVAVRLDESLEFEVNVSAVTGTGPTLAIEVIGADDGALTSNVVSLGRIDPVIATGQAAKNYYVDGELFTKKRFVGLRYTMAGTTPTATVSAAMGVGRQRDYQQ